MNKMYESLLILLFVLLFISIIAAIAFGYIWLKYDITPFYEAPYNITQNVARIATGIAIFLMIVTFIALFYFMISYTSEKKEVIGNVIYEAPMWRTD